MPSSEKKDSGLSAEWAKAWSDSTADLAIFSLTPAGFVSSWNAGGTAIYGYAPDEIVGRHYRVFFSDGEPDRHTLEIELDEASKRGSYVTEGWRKRKDGSVFWASVVTSALPGSDGLPRGFVKVVRDESDKRKAHDAVIESERRFRLLVEGVTDYSIFMLSPQGRVTNWNNGARRIKGYTAEEIIGSHFSRFYTPEDAAAGLPERALDTAAHAGRFESEGWRVRRDGTRFWAHVIVDAIRDESGELIGFAKITRDVTEKREAEQLLEQTRAELFRSQKMEAIGKLTGGVAHDFNNVLQVLRGNLELLQSRCPRDEWMMERVSNAIDAVERGAKLSAQLLAFGRRQALQPVAVNLAAMVRDMDELLRRALGETVKVETVVSGGLWNAFVDTHQLENVVLNLAINARDAMPDGGKLTLEIANAMLDDSYVRSLSDVPPGQYVMLGVTDTGTGMSPEVIERAFEPFFTTKAEGEGTGLGLSMAYGFVKQSGGHIRIYSEVGHGTTVRIYLPRSLADAYEPAPRWNSPMTGGSETVLVVEDDKKVQATVIEMLAELGYSVLKADNAEQALAVLSSGVHIDLLFTDVVMPGSLKSPEMARRAVQIQPHIHVLFTSGYTQNAIVHGGRLDPGVQLLSKPYSREELAFKIRRVLGFDGPALPMSPDANQPQATSAPDRSAKRVLVVEDDDPSREAVSELLSVLGYQVVRAANATEALRALNDGSFDVLLTDLRLPDMPGTELARRVIEAYGKTRIIFASGDVVLSDMAQGFPWQALRKPYSLAELMKALDLSFSR
ncbi:hybrid sensor histidine kinase/response regulator [Caballeronia ptereochthonis]|uniref:histidine kinase n=1 Tax=Caballeronia ptereochthonis TaxID=1777144 RepID=A0A158AG03_9BURK|nr:PAS domain S-box protein [Caballeronia ptereochthonis]SAK56660.1 sensor kinase/response regulator fusion protein [Caballeronia ptereochthonis]